MSFYSISLQVIKVAEKTVVDRNILADIVRKGGISGGRTGGGGKGGKGGVGGYNLKNDKLDKYDNKLNNSRLYWQGSNFDPRPLDSDCGVYNIDYLGDNNGTMDLDETADYYGDNLNNTNNISKNNNINNNNLNNRAKKIIDYDSNESLVGCGDKENIERDSDIMEIKYNGGKINIPSKDLSKFRAKQEKELNKMKEMVRLKQAYVEHMQNSNSNSST